MAEITRNSSLRQWTLIALMVLSSACGSSQDGRRDSDETSRLRAELHETRGQLLHAKSNEAFIKGFMFTSCVIVLITGVAIGAHARKTSINHSEKEETIHDVDDEPPAPRS